MENPQEWASWGLLGGFHLALSLQHGENRNSAWALPLSRISSPALGFLCQWAATLPTVRETKAVSSSHHSEIPCCLKPFLAQLSSLHWTSRPSSVRKILNLPGIFSCSLAWSPAGWAAGCCATASLQAQGTEAAAERGQSPLWPDIQEKCCFSCSQRQNLAKVF